MKKRFLNAIFLGALLVGTMGTVTSCKDYDDDIKSLQDDVAALKKTVGDLQTAISGGAVITGISPTANGVVVTLSDGKTFTITNGANGADGKDGTDGTPGKDGSIVTIGENGNWFIDGEDTGFPSRGEAGAPGEKGDTGEAGAPGEPGANGQNGENAPTKYYEPGVEGDETGFWIEVIETAADTTRVNTNIKWAATSNSAINAVWDTEKGTLTLTGAAEDGESIVLTLWAKLNSLAFVPMEIKDGMGLISSYTLTYDKGRNQIVTLLSKTPTATYRLNPQNAEYGKYQYSFIAREVATRVDGDIDDFVESEGEYTYKDGALTFDLKIDKERYDDMKKTTPIVALKAEATDGSVYVSDYAQISYYNINSYDMDNGNEDGAHFAYVDPSLSGDEKLNAYITNSYNYATAQAKFYYKDGKIDLNNLPILTGKGSGISYDLLLESELGVTVKYDFSLDLNGDGKIDAKDKVTKGDSGIDQQQYVSFKEPGILTNIADGTGVNAKGMSPVVRVTASINGTVVLTRFMKIDITGEEVVPPATDEIEFAAPKANLTYADLKPVSIDLSSLLGNTNIDMSANEFKAAYTGITVVNDPSTTVDESTIIDNKSIIIDESGKPMLKFEFNSKVPTSAGKGKAVVKLAATNKPTIVVTMDYTIEKPDMPTIYDKSTRSIDGWNGSEWFNIKTTGVDIFKEFYNSNYFVVDNPETTNVDETKNLDTRHISKLYFEYADNATSRKYDLSTGDYAVQKLTFTGTPTEPDLEKDLICNLNLVAELENGEKLESSIKITYAIPFTAKIKPVSLSNTNPEVVNLGHQLVLQKNGKDVAYYTEAIKDKDGNITTAAQWNFAKGSGLDANIIFVKYSETFGDEDEAMLGNNLKFINSTGLINGTYNIEWDQYATLSNNVTSDSKVEVTLVVDGVTLPYKIPGKGTITIVAD
ncbi:MAG: collagen-like protein [Prevotellaceae bacterium]|jgi:hypothetical protein|nr:collagen-like protein [Prevotellaceae bacterium]